MDRSTEEIREMTTTFQRGDQDGPKTGSRWQLERSHYAQQRCRWQAAHRTSWRVASHLPLRLTLSGVTLRLAAESQKRQSLHFPLLGESPIRCGRAGNSAIWRQHGTLPFIRNRYDGYKGGPD